MKNKSAISNLAQKGLDFLERRAEKKANVECHSFIYELEVPKKLKKNGIKGLACVLTATSVLMGSIGTYKADDYTYRGWSTYKMNAVSGYQTSYVSLYNTDEDYEWAVTSFHSGSYGYAYVELNGVNNTVVMLNKNGVADTTISNRLSQVKSAKFIRKNKTGTDTYARFVIEMYPYDEEVTFMGYVKILS